MDQLKMPVRKMLCRVIRLERAAALLRNGRSVAEAAACSGFDNPKYFSTVFKKYFGVSPSKYQ